MITVIITDLDNTLLRSDKTISEYTVNVLQRCRAAGIKIAFATARSIYSCLKFFKMFTPDIFAGYGGALVMAGEKIIRRSAIPPDISNHIIKECLETPAVISIKAVTESGTLSNDSQSNKPHYHYTDFTREQNNHFLKIEVYANDPIAVETIASHFPLCDMLRYTGENLYRFANKNAVKWDAVKAIAEYYNYDTETFAAFGDDYNDLEMIEKCGTGVAVSNAVDEVRAAANYICETNDHDGVAKWLENNGCFDLLSGKKGGPVSGPGWAYS